MNEKRRKFWSLVLLYAGCAWLGGSLGIVCGLWWDDPRFYLVLVPTVILASIARMIAGGDR